jgi:hypothetical protein
MEGEHPSGDVVSDISRDDINEWSDEKIYKITYVPAEAI